MWCLMSLLPTTWYVDPKSVISSSGSPKPSTILLSLVAFGRPKNKYSTKANWPSNWWRLKLCKDWIHFKYTFFRKISSTYYLFYYLYFDFTNIWSIFAVSLPSSLEVTWENWLLWFSNTPRPLKAAKPTSFPNKQKSCKKLESSPSCPCLNSRQHQKWWLTSPSPNPKSSRKFCFKSNKLALCE